MPKRAAGLVLTGVAVVLVIVPGHAQTDWRTKAFVPPAIPMLHPVPRPGATERLLMQVARAAGIPFGFEWSREPLPDQTAVPAPADFSGMTIAQALNAIQSADPRYAWREQDGILVIRPQTAWTDPCHFFNRPVGTVNVVGTTWGPMLWRIRDWIYPGLQAPPAWRQPPSIHAPFDVHVNDGTVLNVLDETVKSAGDMYWCLSYGGSCTALRPQPTSTIVWISVEPLKNGGGPGSGGSVIHRGLPPPWTGSRR